MNIHTLTVSLTMTKLLAFKTAQRVGNVNIHFNKLIGTNHDIFWWFRSIESKNKCISLAFDVALLHRYIVAVSNSLRIQFLYDFLFRTELQVSASNKQGAMQRH